jgi:putative membrane protein
MTIPNYIFLKKPGGGTMKHAADNDLLRGHHELERILSDHDRGRLDRLIAEAEKRTKTQIVLAVIKRSDSYAELPWKAFALGASIAGLSVFLPGPPFADWSQRITALAAAAAILAGGAVFALLTVFARRFARIFLSSHRAGTEVRQYAESLFLSRELFSTGGRTGILLLVSLFERRVVLLPDRGLSNRLTGDAMRDIIAAMTPLLRRNEVHRALETGLERLTRILETSAQGRPEGTGKNELSDEIIEEKGV